MIKPFVLQSVPHDSLTYKFTTVLNLNKPLTTVIHMTHDCSYKSLAVLFSCMFRSCFGNLLWLQQWLTPNSYLTHTPYMHITLNTSARKRLCFWLGGFILLHIFLPTYPHLIKCLCWTTEQSLINFLTKDSPRRLTTLFVFVVKTSTT